MTSRRRPVSRRVGWSTTRSRVRSECATPSRASRSGTILIGILGHPFKCPPAPFEGALLLHDHLVERGIRADAEIRVIGPMAAPVPITKELSKSILDALQERRIEYVPRQRVVELDRAANRRDSKAAERSRTTFSSGSLCTECLRRSRAPGSPLMGGCPWTRQTSRPDFRTCTRWAMSPGCPWPRPVCSPRPRARSWPTTSLHVCAARNFSSPTRAPELLHRVRRRDGRQGRGQLPRRSGSDSTARRPLSGSCPGEGHVCLDSACALVWILILSHKRLSRDVFGKVRALARAASKTSANLWLRLVGAT